MEILKVLADCIAVISALFAFSQAVSVKNEIKKYKDLVSSKIAGQEIASLYNEAKRCEAIIIRYRSKSTISNGKNSKDDLTTILSFIAKIKEYQSILGENVGNGYFEKMNIALNRNSFSDMYIYTCGVIDHLKCLKDKVTM